GTEQEIIVRTVMHDDDAELQQQGNGAHHQQGHAGAPNYRPGRIRCHFQAFSKYPTPRMVWMAGVAAQAVNRLRKRETCASMALGVTSSPKPYNASSKRALGTTRPLCRSSSTRMSYSRRPISITSSLMRTSPVTVSTLTLPAASRSE